MTSTVLPILLGSTSPPLFDHSGSPGDNVLGIFKVADTPQQVETIGVEGLDLDKMGCIADQHH